MTTEIIWNKYCHFMILSVISSHLNQNLMLFIVSFFLWKQKSSVNILMIQVIWTEDDVKNKKETSHEQLIYPKQMVNLIYWYRVHYLYSWYVHICIYYPTIMNQTIEMTFFWDITLTQIQYTEIVLKSFNHFFFLS